MHAPTLPSLVVALLLPPLLGACGPEGTDGTDGDDTAAEDAAGWSSWDVTAPGPHGVGFVAVEHTYEPVPGESRTILINVWYPTDATEGEAVSYSDRFPAEPDVYGGAPPAPPAHDGGYPLHLHSHGDQAYGGAIEAVMRGFASHGWVGAAPDHTDNLLFDNADPTPQGHWYHRPSDLRAVADWLADPEGDHGLGGDVDTEAFVVSGHSRGTSTAWSLAGAAYDMARVEGFCPDCDAAQQALFSDGALSDPRVTAVMPLAGGLRSSLFGDDPAVAAAPVTAPVLHMTGSEDGDGQAAVYDALSTADPAPPITWVDLEGGCHNSFTLGLCSTLDVDDGFALTTAWMLAFSRVHHLGDDTAAVRDLVDGTTSLDDRVAVQVAE